MDKEQLKQNAAIVDGQFNETAKVYGTSKYVIYLVGALAAIGLVTLIVWVL